MVKLERAVEEFEDVFPDNGQMDLSTVEHDSSHRVIGITGSAELFSCQLLPRTGFTFRGEREGAKARIQKSKSLRDEDRFPKKERTVPKSRETMTAATRACQLLLCTDDPCRVIVTAFSPRKVFFFMRKKLAIRTENRSYSAPKDQRTDHIRAIRTNNGSYWMNGPKLGSSKFPKSLSIRGCLTDLSNKNYWPRLHYIREDCKTVRTALIEPIYIPMQDLIRTLLIKRSDIPFAEESHGLIHFYQLREMKATKKCNV
ncbi:hypothetical protein ACLOJK_016351 [Asimina triloba]